MPSGSRRRSDPRHDAQGGHAMKFGKNAIHLVEGTLVVIVVVVVAIAFVVSKM
jgi:hypothetical protein